MLKELIAHLGLAMCPPFYRDRQFVWAVGGAVALWLILWATAPGFFAETPHQVGLLLSLILWQPLLEELLFRGVIQGQIRLHVWGREKRWGLTHANLLTSLLFVLVHFFYHPPLWAISVFFPSLVFGHFRDKYGSIYAALVLHVYYNAGYFLFGLLKAS